MVRWHMAKVGRSRRRSSYRQCRMAPYHLRTCGSQIEEQCCPKGSGGLLDKKDWEDVTCSVCMECPHNAVLLLCSSHDKGCRPYMCGTSFRYSNCLDQYKKAYANRDVEQCEISELACPLCRGQVKGWTVVEPAREYLNSKERSCMQDDCSFVGTYKELRKHMKGVHPCATPRGVDPLLEQKWGRLERERERDDVLSTIRSTMPGSLVFGDYVIERNHGDFDSDDDEDMGFSIEAANRREGGGFVGFDRNLANVFMLLHAFGSASGSHHQSEGAGGGMRHPSPVGGLASFDEDIDHHHTYDWTADGNNDDSGGETSLASRLRGQGQLLFNSSGRRRRRRDLDGGGS
ncbi:unnamed protein product [Linum tenue]|uniref:Uncharacterized protein n=1 Tax=Linum tenue TaxID=586396 RepID=A0AAV0GSN7_9ROSI|nr:unnamed protein product [Linum tenue]